MSVSTNDVYNVSRSEAARLLSVSVRTIDRYLKQGKVSFVKTKGRTWLSKSDIKRLFDADVTVDPRKAAFYTETDNDNYRDIHTDNVEFKTESSQKINSDFKNNQNSLINYEAKYLATLESLNFAHSQVFKLKRYIGYAQRKMSQMRPVSEVREVQQKLNLANSDYRKHLSNLQTSYKSKFNVLENTINKKNQQIESERLNRNAILLILIILISLQPILWLVLR